MICKQLKSHRGHELIYVEEVAKNQWAPTVCMHCQQAPCVQVCPSEALVRTPEGIVKSPDESRCLACSNCVLVCPFGVPRLSEDRKIMKSKLIEWFKAMKVYPETALDRYAKENN